MWPDMRSLALVTIVIWWGKVLVSMKVIVCVCDVKGVLALIKINKVQWLLGNIVKCSAKSGVTL